MIKDKTTEYYNKQQNIKPQNAAAVSSSNPASKSEEDVNAASCAEEA